MSDKLVNITLKLNDKVSKPLRNAQKSFDQFVKSKFGWADTVSKSFGALSKAAGAPKLNKSIGDLSSSLSKVGKESLKLGGMILGGTTFGIAGMVALAKSTGNVAGHLVDNVKRIGFNVEAYQELQYAAKRTGMATEDFDKSMQKMVQSIGEAKAGQGALYSFLTKTNPALLKQVLAAKNNEEAFNILIGALGSLKDASKQAMFANIAFGKSGSNLTNLANTGSAGILKLREEARELGILTEEQVMQANSLGDTMNALEQVLKAIKNTIGASLIPVIKTMGEEFIAFYKENKGELDKFLKTFQQNLPEIIENLKSIFKGMVEAVSKAIDIFNWLGKTIGYSNTVIALIASTIGSGLVAAVALAAKAFIGLGITMMSTPIGWIIAGIAALVGALYLLKKAGELAWEVLKSGAVIVFEAFEATISGIVNMVKKVKSFLPDWLGGEKNTIDVNQTQKTLSTVKTIQEAQTIKNESEIKVKFDNMPRGARVETKGSSNVETNISMGLMATSTI